MHLDQENDGDNADPVSRAVALNRASESYDQRGITRLWRPEAVIVAASLFIGMVITAAAAHAWVVMAIGLIALVYPVTYAIDWRRNSARQGAR